MDVVRHATRHPDRPILITEAPVNVDDEYNHRRKRYLIMMIIRALCIIGAASTFGFSGWLAAAFVAAALVLPWCAVLIANNRPPKQAVRFRRFLPGSLGRHELVAGPAPEAGRWQPGAEQPGHDAGSEQPGHDASSQQPGREAGSEQAPPAEWPEHRIIDI